jgi:RNA polymerase sigma-70 factor (sigma-E family)
VQSDRVAIVVETTSFDDFVCAHRDALVRYAALLCRSAAHAEDLVQEVLVRIYPRWRELASDGSCYAYVRKAITNEYLSWRRRWSTRHIEHVEPERLDLRLVDPWDDGDDTLWESLCLLPRQQRAAVVLRYYEGLTDSEIAEAMGCREATVRGHVSRGLAKLRASMGARHE